MNKVNGWLILVLRGQMPGRSLARPPHCRKGGMLYSKEELGSSSSVILTLRRLRQGDCGFGFTG